VKIVRRVWSWFTKSNKGQALMLGARLLVVLLQLTVAIMTLSTTLSHLHLW
jgi:hypothetical protein